MCAFNVIKIKCSGKEYIICQNYNCDVNCHLENTLDFLVKRPSLNAIKFSECSIKLFFTTIGISIAIPIKKCRFK